MKIALLTTDNRENYRTYTQSEPHFGTAPEALLQGFALMPEVEVHVISCAQEKMTNPTKLGANIYFHGLHVPKIGWLRTGYQGCVRAVRKKLREIAPDVVHGQGTERDCSLCAVLGGFPNVVTIHGNMAELARLFKRRIGTYGWLAAQFEQFTLRKTAGVFCNSEYTESLVAQRTPKTWRVANPIREPFFTSPRPSKEPGGKCVLLNVGVLNPRKRQVELLDAARKIHEQGFEFELQFIGLVTPEQEYDRTFLTRLKEAEAKGYARHLGMKSTREIIQCFDQAHGLLHFPTEEAFGLVVAEAMARELKFFGARLGGIVDISKNVPGAELFAADDWDGLVNSVAQWIREGHHRVPGTASTIESRYHPRVIATRHLEIYREVLSTRK